MCLRRLLGVLACIFVVSCEPRNGQDATNAGGELQPLPPAGTALEISAQCMALGMTATMAGGQAPDHVMHWTALASLGDRARAAQLAEQWARIFMDDANATRVVEASALCSTRGSFASLVAVPPTFADFPADPVARLGACEQVLASAAALGGDNMPPLVTENHQRLLAYEIVLEGDGVDVGPAKRVGEQWYRARPGAGQISSVDFQGCMRFAMDLRPV